MLEFNNEDHQYKLDGKPLISVTQLLRKQQLAPDYSVVNSEVLQASAEKGTLIHEEIEKYCKYGDKGFTAELLQFANYVNMVKMQPLENELMVSNDLIAGTIDMIYKQGNETYIADIKTTSTIHTDAVSWQLSLYAYLYKGNINREVGKCFHFDKEGLLKVVDIKLKPIEEVEKLIECERTGTTYKQELTTIESELQELTSIELVIANIEAQKKQAETKAIELRSYIMKAMQENAVKSLENDKLKITLVGATTRTSIDSARLKKEHPEIAQEYQKISEVKPSLRITIKGGKENEL